MRDATVTALIQGVAPVIHGEIEPLKAQIAALQARVAELEARPALKYLGTWKEGKTYSAGTFITDAGAMWHCNASTTSRPGENADWSLAVKSAPVAHARSDTTTVAARNGSSHTMSRPRTP